MMTHIELLEELSKYVSKLYFIKRDVKELESFLSTDVTWIGIGKTEVCLRRNEIIEIFQKKKDDFGGTFTILDEHYVSNKISDEVYITVADIKIKFRNDCELLKESHLHLTLLWRREETGWKIVHLHNSIPTGTAENLEYFNVHLSQIKYKTISEKVESAIMSDQLTKLNNLHGFEVHMQEIVEKKPDAKYAIVRLKIKNLDYINQKVNYLQGERIIKQIASNLSDCVGEYNLCGRIEEDQFLVLFQYKEIKDIKCLLHTLQEQLMLTDIVRDVMITLTLNFGIYLLHDNANYIFKELIHKTVLALDSISDTGDEINYAFYEKAFMNHSYLQNEILNEAVSAMEQEDFKCYIQPQIDLNTCEVIGGEVLTRWHLNNGKIRMPDDYIPVFEKHHLIMKFDLFVLDMLCKQVQEWIQSGIAIPPLSINQSRMHMQDEAYYDKFCAVIDKYAIPHELIVYELTETGYIENGDNMVQIIKRLHENGFKIAIDDFGTGYASLNLLSLIDVDILKVDKSLLSTCEENEKASIIMQEIISLAHRMSMKVICEGVETVKQAQFLKQQDCDIGQGYLYSKPIEIHRFVEEWVMGNH